MVEQLRLRYMLGQHSRIRLVPQRPRVAPDPVVVGEGADVALGRERHAAIVEKRSGNTPIQLHEPYQDGRNDA